MNNQDIAKKVIEALGGRENVNSVAHCATRLRVDAQTSRTVGYTVNVLTSTQGFDDLFCNILIVHLQKSPYKIL